MEKMSLAEGGNNEESFFLAHILLERQYELLKNENCLLLFIPSLSRDIGNIFGGKKKKGKKKKKEKKM